MLTDTSENLSLNAPRLEPSESRIPYEFLVHQAHSQESPPNSHLPSISLKKSPSSHQSFLRILNQSVDSLERSPKTQLGSQVLPGASASNK